MFLKNIQRKLISSSYVADWIKFEKRRVHQKTSIFVEETLFFCFYIVGVWTSVSKYVNIKVDNNISTRHIWILHRSLTRQMEHAGRQRVWSASWVKSGKGKNSDYWIEKFPFESFFQRKIYLGFRPEQSNNMFRLRRCPGDKKFSLSMLFIPDCCSSLCILRFLVPKKSINNQKRTQNLLTQSFWNFPRNPSGSNSIVNFRRKRCSEEKCSICVFSNHVSFFFFPKMPMRCQLRVLQNKINKNLSNTCVKLHPSVRQPTGNQLIYF